MTKWEMELLEKAPDRDVAEKIRSSLLRLLSNDKYLFDVDANERSISHRLALYLGEKFQGWDIDCEYNRDGHNPKRLRLDPAPIFSDDDKATTVYPDIIVHHRGKLENHLAIEIKKNNGGSEAKDLLKLNALRKELRYNFALFIRFQTEAEEVDISHIQWSLD